MANWQGLSGLTVLDLAGNNMTGRLPPDLASVCPQLATLNLSSNAFSGTLHLYHGENGVGKGWPKHTQYSSDKPSSRHLYWEQVPFNKLQTVLLRSVQQELPSFA